MDENFADKVILVIDDDDMNLRIAQMILEKKLPCRVLTANSGRQGIEILRSQYVSLVLLDVLMPDFDGIETLQEIRADEKLDDIPVIMLTANVDKTTIKKCITLGVTDYVKKPFMPDELINRVKKKLIESERTIEKILIIDEDAKNLRRLQLTLEENFPYKVLTAASGIAGIKILSETKISLVIASAEMKFISGFKILNFMASDEKFSNVPFVLTNAENIVEMVDKIKNPPPAETPDSAVIHSGKNKIANVVTTLIGYELDVKI